MLFVPAVVGNVVETVELDVGDTRNGVDFEFSEASTTATLEGRVEGPSAAGPGTSVFAEVDLGSTSLCDSPVAVVTTSADGRFAIPSLASGNYRLTATTVRIANAQRSTEWGLNEASVESATREPSLIEMRPGAEGEGRFIVKGAGRGPQSVTGRARVSLRRTDGCYSGVPAQALVVKDRFALRGLPPGQYLLTASGLPPDWTVESISVDGIDRTRSPIRLQAGEGIEIAITVTRNRGTLSGTVTDSRGQPSSRATVFVLPADGTVAEKMIDAARYRSVRPDSAGIFALSGLPPGNYLVGTVPEGDCRSCDDPEFVETALPRFQRVALLHNERRTVNIRDIGTRTPRPAARPETQANRAIIYLTDQAIRGTLRAWQPQPSPKLSSRPFCSSSTTRTATKPSWRSGGRMAS